MSGIGDVSITSRDSHNNEIAQATRKEYPVATTIGTFLEKYGTVLQHQSVHKERVILNGATFTSSTE